MLCHLNEASQQLLYQKVPTVGMIVLILTSLLLDYLNSGDNKVEEENASRGTLPDSSQTPMDPAVQHFKKFLVDDLEEVKYSARQRFS